MTKKQAIQQYKKQIVFAVKKGNRHTFRQLQKTAVILAKQIGINKVKQAANTAVTLVYKKPVRQTA